MNKNKTIIVEINEGCIDVTYAPYDIIVIVIDHDDLNNNKSNAYCPLCNEMLNPFPNDGICYFCNFDVNNPESIFLK